MPTPTDAAEGRPAGSSQRAPRRGAFWVAIGIFLSRIAGVFRQVLVANFFGTGPLADAWTAALRLPAVLQNLLGEGSLSASFIPVYAEQIGDGRPEVARRFAGVVLGLLLTVAGVLVLVGVAATPFLVDALMPGYSGDQRAGALLLLPLLIPMAGLAVLAAWALGILNTHRHFLLSYSAPVLWNLSIVGALLAGGVGLGLRDLELLRWMGWGALIGGGLQFLVQLPTVVRRAGWVRPSLKLKTEGVNEALRNFLPVVGARGFESLSGFLREVTLASLLAGGAVSILGYVQPFYLLPISLFGLSVAAAELPELSQRRREATEVLAARVASGLQSVQFWVVPTVVGYIVLGGSLMSLVYRRGSFSGDDATAAHYVLAAVALGLVASASSRLLSSTFYALRDAATPARIAVFRIVVSFGLGAALMFPFDRLQTGSVHLGAVGLGLGAAAAAWLEYVLLRIRVRRRIGTHGPGVGATVRVWASALFAGGVTWGVQRLVAQEPWTGAMASIGLLSSFGVIYLVVARILGLEIPGRSRRT